MNKKLLEQWFTESVVQNIDYPPNIIIVVTVGQDKGKSMKF